MKKTLQAALVALMLMPTMAVAQDFGEGLAAFQSGDYEAALIEWHPLAERGNRHAQNNLGLMYEKGFGVPLNLAEAKNWYEKAAAQGLSKGQANLNRLLSFESEASLSDTTSETFQAEEAKTALEGAENNRLLEDAGAVIDKAREAMRADDYQEAFKLLRPLAEQGNAEAQVFLGGMYARGNGVVEDEAEAIKWYLLAAEQSNISAQIKLASIHSFGLYGNPVDWTEASKWYRMAAEQGDPWAQYSLAVLNYQGQGLPADVSEAIKWFSRSAEQGNFYAQNGLAYTFSMGGDGVQPNYVEAAKWYHIAAEEGVFDARVNLGKIYFLGQGVPKDEVEAMKWYRLAAEKAHGVANDKIGWFELPDQIRSFPPSTDAWAILERAGKEGNAEAQTILGIVNSTGWEPNNAEAANWYRLAANQGNAEAQFNLALLYVEGGGVLQDFQEAANLYRLAAKNGHAEAQNSLGQGYVIGQGVPIDKVSAHMWFNIASVNGYFRARGNRDRLAREMTPADISKAQERARVCMESGYKDCD